MKLNKNSRRGRKTVSTLQQHEYHNDSDTIVKSFEVDQKGRKRLHLITHLFLSASPIVQIWRFAQRSSVWAVVFVNWDRNTLFVITLSLSDNRDPLFGVIVCPAFDKLATYRPIASGCVIDVFIWIFEIIQTYRQLFESTPLVYVSKMVR